MRSNASMLAMLAGNLMAMGPVAAPSGNSARIAPFVRPRTKLYRPETPTAAVDSEGYVRSTSPNPMTDAEIKAQSQQRRASIKGNKCKSKKRAKRRKAGGGSC